MWEMEEIMVRAYTHFADEYGGEYVRCARTVCMDLYVEPFYGWISHGKSVCKLIQPNKFG